jgi:hypothetical protein
LTEVVQEIDYSRRGHGLCFIRALLSSMSRIIQHIEEKGHCEKFGSLVDTHPLAIRELGSSDDESLVSTDMISVNIKPLEIKTADYSFISDQHMSENEGYVSISSGLTSTDIVSVDTRLNIVSIPLLTNGWWMGINQTSKLLATCLLFNMLDYTPH